MAVPWMPHFMLEQDLLREWIKKAKAGDLDAFERILLLHERTVLRFAQRLLGNSEDARTRRRKYFFGCTSTSAGFEKRTNSAPGCIA